MKHSAAIATGGGRLAGLGLRLWELAVILSVSTVSFLFWGGPLWNAPSGDSHVWRIGGSYLLVVPLVLATLARARRATVGHVVGSVGVIWSAKLLITATLYAGIAPGSAMQYAPARTWEGAAQQDPAHRESPPPMMLAAGLETGEVSGVVTANGVGERLAVVVLEDLHAAPFVRPSAVVEIAIEHAHYGRSVYVATTQDRIVLSNRDASLHLLRMSQDQRAIANVPVPAGSREHVLSMPLPGLYFLSCENHDSERALLVVVDHPFFSITDTNGRFRIEGVPVGDHVAVVLRSAHVPERRTITLAPSRSLELSIDLR